MAINVQNGEIGNLSTCLNGKYFGAILFTSTPCSAELTSDGKVLFTVDGTVRTFQRPFVYEGYTKKTAAVGLPGSGYSTTGYSIIWRADGMDLQTPGTELQSLVLDFNNDLHDGLQLRHSIGSTSQTCFLTVP
jgi:hypothetical protein